jgi:hypothetical protein
MSELTVAALDEFAEIDLGLACCLACTAVSDEQRHKTKGMKMILCGGRCVSVGGGRVWWGEWEGGVIKIKIRRNEKKY